MNANLQVESGNYTRIINPVLDNLLKFPFPENTGIPIRLVLFVIRKTWGYNKTKDVISLTQFEKGVNASRPAVTHWLEYLVKARLLVKGVLLVRNGYTYSFNKYYDQWLWGVTPLLLVTPRHWTSNTPVTKTSNTPVTHKRQKTITKDKCLFFSNKYFSKTWDEYREMRIKIKRPMTEKAEQMAINKLDGVDVETATKMLEQSIFNSWQGIFPVKEQPKEDDEMGKATKHRREFYRKYPNANDGMALDNFVNINKIPAGGVLKYKSIFPGGF